MRLPAPAVVLAFALSALAAPLALHDAGARFADAAGFSGKAGGQTCIACHAPAHPTHGDAQAHLEGLPGSWRPGESYPLTVRVTGGPPAMPAPQPQGGFDLAASAGRFAVADGGLLRVVAEGTEVTYRPAGTLMRDWQVEWSAPGLSAPPQPVRLWLAVLAANGNHVVATNASDQGETLDAAAHLSVEVPPHPDALAAWLALPLLSPEAALSPTADAVLVEGRHRDGNATRLSWSLDGGAWRGRDTAPSWLLRLEGLAPGDHALALASEGAGRRSPDSLLTFRVAGGEALPPSGRSAAGLPALPLLLALLPLALAATTWRPRP